MDSRGRGMRPVLIDTDPGIDDALALLFAWASPEVVVEAVTTVAGNVTVDVATANLARLLALRPPVHRPRIAVGAAAPLGRALVTATHYHGEDGLGDTADWPVPLMAVEPGHAAGLIVETARRHGSRLTVVALGPLTNVALALEADAAAMAGIGRIVVIGGAVDVAGNVTAEAEFNIHVDPEAAARVFAAGLPLDIVPLDATRQALLLREHLEAALADAPLVVAERVAAFTERGFRVDTARGTRGMVLHDPLAVGVAVQGEIVDWHAARLVVGAGGATRRVEGPPNCRVAMRVHAERFLARFLDRLSAAP